MQRLLERLIPQLTKAVARAEIPASERATARVVVGEPLKVRQLPGGRVG